jgi:hypothetical protein
MYSTNTASGPAAVLQALATFASSAGFTIDNNAAYSGGWWLAVHKGSCYLNFVSDSANTQITVYGATGFSSSSAPSAQAQSSSGFGCNSGVGPYVGYHFFSTSGSAAYLHVAIEISAGLFAHVQGGALNSIGSAAPCIYVQATNWQYTGYWSSFPDTSSNYMPWSNYSGQSNGAVGVTVDGTFRWFKPGNSQPARSVLPLSYPGNGVACDSLTKSPNTFNGLAPFFPIQVFVERTVGNIYAYVGDAPDLRILNMKNNNPKDEITIGSDTWKVFPMVSNSLPVSTGNAPPSSGNYAMAFRKNA